MKAHLFKDRRAWRAWLQEHHTTAPEIWLIYYKKHVDKASVQQAEAVEEALCFGWIDSLVRTIDDERYQQRYTPRKAKSNWSQINKARVRKLIKLGLMTPAGLAKIEAAKQDGSWDRLDEIELDPTIPDDLASALDRNPPARQNFDAFAPSYQKQYLYWLLSAKRDATRQKRIAEIVRRSQQNIKPGPV